MHIQYFGYLTAVQENVVKEEVKLTIKSGMDELDQDALDHMAELSAMKLGAYLNISASAGSFSAPCYVKSITGNYTSKTVQSVLLIDKADVDQNAGRTLITLCRMELKLTVEVSNRQMRFDDLVMKNKGPDSVTLTANGRSVTMTSETAQKAAEILKAAKERHDHPPSL
jgi:hypothetical protein